MTDKSPRSLVLRAIGAVFVVLVVAVASRVAWELLAPLVPSLAIVSILALAYFVAVGRRNG